MTNLVTLNMNLVLLVMYATIVWWVFGFCDEVWPDHVAQSVTCLATDVSLNADPGVANSTPAWPHTFMEIDHEIIFTVVLLPSAESSKKGCCQLQAKVCARSTG